MREVSSKECAFLCRFNGLPMGDLPSALTHTGPRNSVNQLAATFVESLQQRLPSTIYTVLRTASNLQPFDWNMFEYDKFQASSAVTRATARKTKRDTDSTDKQAGAFPGTQRASVSEGEGEGSAFCCVCDAPLPQSSAASGVSKAAAHCYSCQNQIVSKFKAPQPASCDQTAAGDDDGTRQNQGDNRLSEFLPSNAAISLSSRLDIMDLVGLNPDS